MFSFARILVRLWIRDPDFRSLVILVFLTLSIGTVVYSLQEGWGVIRRVLLQRHHADHRRLRRSRPNYARRQALHRRLHLERLGPHRGLHKCDSGGEFEQADEET